MDTKEELVPVSGASATLAVVAHSGRSSKSIVAAPEAILQHAQEPSIHSNGIDLGPQNIQHPTEGIEREQSAANCSAASDAELQRRKAMLLQQAGSLSF